MVVLFGSYARGDWVEDIHTECHTIHVYKSDFDILVIIPIRYTLNAIRYFSDCCKKSYRITKKQLEYLAKRVKLLQRLTNKICKEKIESFV